MAVSKLSQIVPAPSAFTSGDSLVGVRGGTTDLLFSSAQVGLNPSSTAITGGTDTCILFDKAGVVGEDTNFEWNYTNHILSLGKNNNAGGIDVYNVYIGGGATYERGVLDWITTTNVLTIGAQNNGGGTLRNVSFVGGGQFTFAGTGSGNYTTTIYTGNSFLGFNGGTGFVEALSVNLTNNKQFLLGDPDYLGNASAIFLRYISQNGITGFSAMLGDGSANANFVIGDVNTVVSVLNVLGLSGSGDTGLSRASAGVVAFGNTTAGDASATIKSKTKAGAVVAADLTSGSWAVIRDTVNNTTKLYYNNAGTLMAVALV